MIIGDGKRCAVVLCERLQHGVTIVRGANRHQLGIVDLQNLGVGVGEDQIRQADILHQLAAGIDHVDPIECFLATSGLPDFGKRARGGHVRIDPGVLRRHVATGRVFGIAEQLARGLELAGIELQEQLPRDLGGHLLEETSAVVGCHLVEQSAHLVVR